MMQRESMCSFNTYKYPRWGWHDVFALVRGILGDQRRESGYDLSVASTVSWVKMCVMIYRG